MTSPHSHLVSEPALSDLGFRGWWEPLDRLIASITVNGQDVLVASSTPWDGSARGHHNSAAHPKQAEGKVGEYFKCFDPLQGVIGEILKPSQMPYADRCSISATVWFPTVSFCTAQQV